MKIKRAMKRAGKDDDFDVVAEIKRGRYNKDIKNEFNIKKGHKANPEEA